MVRIFPRLLLIPSHLLEGQLLIDDRPLPEGGSPEARPDQENKGSVGAEESEEGKKKKGSLGDSEEESDDESEGGVKLSEGSVGEKKRAWWRMWRVVVEEEEEEEKKKKNFVRSDLPGYGLLAQTKDILKPRVEKLRYVVVRPPFSLPGC